MAPGLTITTDELVAAIAKCRSTLEHVGGGSGVGHRLCIM